MVPIRLQLRNFMSYGDGVMPLDFNGIHTACLTGDNGHGKSALLDAITWALWGEARASGDELIRLGTEDMRVIFDFELNGDLYRVIRGRSRKSSGNVWELYIAENGGEGEREKGRTDDAEKEEQTSNIQHRTSNVELRTPNTRNPTPVTCNPTNTQHPTPNTVAPSPPLPLPPSSAWRPISGQGIRDTGRVIERILRMDYKTFINSAYIQQGRADEFTKQTVSDRKKILADILDLSRYDKLEEMAKERRREAERLIDELGRDIQGVEVELAQEDGYKEQLEKAKSERDALEAEIAALDAEAQVLQTKRAELDAAAGRARELEQQISGWQSEVSQLATQRESQEKRVLQYREIIQDKDRIVAGCNRLAELRELIAQYDLGLDSVRKLDMERMKLEQAISGEKHKIELDLRSASDELAEVEARISLAAGIDDEVAKLKTKTTHLDELEARRGAAQTEITGFSDRMGELKAQRDRLAEKKADLEEKLALLSEPGARCPLCKTELGHGKHETIIADYRRQIAETSGELQSINKQGAEIKQKRQALEAELASIEASLKTGSEIRTRLAKAEQTQFQVEESRKQLPRVKERVAALTARVKSDDFAQDLRAKLAEVCKKAEAVNYDATQHQKMKDELAQCREFETLSAGLKHAEESLDADESNLRAISELIDARNASIAESRAAAEEVRKSAADLPLVVSQLETVSRSLAAKRDTDRQLTGRIATLDHALERCANLRTEVSEKRKQLDKSKKDKSMYTELVAAFGKKGVQALIIENAIPEIQEEANRLLARMTDNAMQVSIDTVRDKKTGGTAETLDIKISDEMGTRSYELYSGGEAFRVNFALRIALSKLLARRAGAKLQTLIVDEGFGTQDGKGREKLVDVINSIKDDFEKILVITHIEELKDAFPTRIEITKDSGGSQISVN